MVEQSDKAATNNERLEQHPLIITAITYSVFHQINSLQ